MNKPNYWFGIDEPSIDDHIDVHSRGRIYYPIGHYFNDDEAHIIVREGEATRALGFAGGKARHSPDGFAWGYGGSGPAELARAILADVCNVEVSPRLYQRFKEDFIVGLDSNRTDWTIAEDDVRKWLSDIGALAVLVIG